MSCVSIQVLRRSAGGDVGGDGAPLALEGRIVEERPPPLPPPPPPLLPPPPPPVSVPPLPAPALPVPVPVPPLLPAPPAAAPAAPAAPAARVPRVPRALPPTETIRIELPDLNGYLLWNPTKLTLDAHCNTHGAGCKMDRTLKAGGGNSGQGRPLGMLLLWLDRAADSRIKDYHGHSDPRFKRLLGSKLFQADRLRLRLAFVHEASALHGSPKWRVLQADQGGERAKGDDEPAQEPEMVP